MENDPSNQTKTISGLSYQELIDKLNNGSDLTEEELNEIMWCVLFKTLDDSSEADKKDKNNRPLRVKFLTIVGNMFGRQTKFLPYALKYRNEAYGLRKENYEEVFDGYAIASMNVCRENVEVLVKQFDTASSYSVDYKKLSDEIEENIDDGLASFRGFVGMETMVKMDEAREKVLSLSKKYKKI